MRALRVLREARPWSRRTAFRRVVATVGAVLWWWAVLRLAIRPDAAGSWESAMAAGWSLGLIPLHAVPWPPASEPGRVPSDASVRRQGVRSTAVRPDPALKSASGVVRLPAQHLRGVCAPVCPPADAAGQPPVGSPVGAGPRWQRGHQ
jgi:hypothetical protein